MLQSSSDNDKKSVIKITKIVKCEIGACTAIITGLG
jgi:hypothetical protein